MSESKRHMGNQILSPGETFALQIFVKVIFPAAFLEAVSFMLTPRDRM